MDFFRIAVETVFRHEGGFTIDSGGPTQYGISLKFLQGLGDANGDGWLDGDLDRDGDVDSRDIRKLTREQASDIYLTQWWARYRYDLITDLQVATKVLDFAVNMGAGRAHQLLQRSTRGLGIILVEDGIIGPITLGAINSVNPRELVLCYQCIVDGFYRSLAEKNPKKYHGYLKGWLNRCYD
jgi:lysozyme family protein